MTDDKWNLWRQVGKSSPSTKENDVDKENLGVFLSLIDVRVEPDGLSRRCWPLGDVGEELQLPQCQTLQMEKT